MRRESRNLRSEEDASGQEVCAIAEVGEFLDFDGAEYLTITERVKCSG